MSTDNNNNTNTQQPLPPLDAVLSAHLDQRFNKMFQDLQAALKPLQTSVADVQTRSGGRHHLKIGTPPNFNGEREHGESFLKACVLYMQLNASHFDSDEQAVGWMLSYMTEGRAALFRDAALESYIENSCYPWETMEAFTKAFRMEFCPVAEREEALVKLEGDSYFQKSSESVSDYIDSFRALVRKAGVADPATAVLKFRRGLHHTIAHTISTSGAPIASNDIEGWIERAREYDRQRAVDRTIAGGRSVSGPGHPNFLSAFRKEQPNRPPVQASAAPRSKAAGFSILSRNPLQPNPPPATLGTPMELDAARNRQRGLPVPNDVCRRCKQQGHWAKDCPLRFDIRCMTTDEMEEWLAHAKDTAELEGRQEESTEHPEEQGEQEGFGTTSG